MLFSRGCGLYLRAPGFDKTIFFENPDYYGSSKLVDEVTINMSICLLEAFKTEKARTAFFRINTKSVKFEIEESSNFADRPRGETYHGRGAAASTTGYGIHTHT